MKYESIFAHPQNLFPYTVFLSCSYKYADSKKSDTKIEDLSIDEFLDMFPFAQISDKTDKVLSNTRVKEFPLVFFSEKMDGYWYFSNWDINLLQKATGIFTDYNSFQAHIDSLILGSFGIHYEFILQSPYFSRDDNEFYVVRNPMLKENVWKIPMIRASSWKGMLLKTASKVIASLIEKKETSSVAQHFQSVLRIFGTGSEEFREVEEAVRNYMKSEDKHAKGSDGKSSKIDITSKLAKYALYELGINLEFSFDGKSIKEQVWEHLEKDIESFSTKRGRGIFYPTYFNRLNLEIINPHNRKTKAGSQPIYFEVVQEGTGGIFQFIYIPYDGIMLSPKKLKKQVQDDCEFMQILIENLLEERGIGSKRKYGWGRACMVDKSKMCFMNL